MRYFIPKELNTAVVQANIFKVGYCWWCTGTTDVKSTHCENLVLTTDSSATEFGLSTSSIDYGNYDRKINNIEDLELVLNTKFETVKFEDITIMYDGLYDNIPYSIEMDGYKYGIPNTDRSTILDIVEGKLGKTVIFED